MCDALLPIIEISLTFFPKAIKNNKELVESLKKAIYDFLCKKTTFNQAKEIIRKITGTTEPFEKINNILEVSSEPIPCPPDCILAGNKKRKKTRSWTSYEDHRLIAGIYTYGVDNWTLISKFVGNGRTRSQCSQRWSRGLNPRIVKTRWTKQEESKLVEIVQNNPGKSWNQISLKLGNRSDVQCRYRYKKIMRETSSCEHVLYSTSTIIDNISQSPKDIPFFQDDILASEPPSIKNLVCADNFKVQNNNSNKQVLAPIFNGSIYSVF